MHFTCMNHQPGSRLECQAERAHRRQMNKAADAESTNKLKAVYHRETPTSMPLTRPTQDTETLPNDKTKAPRMGLELKLDKHNSHSVAGA